MSDDLQGHRPSLFYGLFDLQRLTGQRRADQLLVAVARGPQSVGGLAQLLNVHVSIASRVLSRLAAAGLLVYEKDGPNHVYRIGPALRARFEGGGVVFFLQPDTDSEVTLRIGPAELAEIEAATRAGRESRATKAGGVTAAGGGAGGAKADAAGSDSDQAKGPSTNGPGTHEQRAKDAKVERAKTDQRKTTERNTKGAGPTAKGAKDAKAVGAPAGAASEKRTSLRATRLGASQAGGPEPMAARPKAARPGGAKPSEPKPTRSQLNGAPPKDPGQRPPEIPKIVVTPAAALPRRAGAPRASRRPSGPG